MDDTLFRIARRIFLAAFVSLFFGALIYAVWEAYSWNFLAFGIATMWFVFTNIVILLEVIRYEDKRRR